MKPLVIGLCVAAFAVNAQAEWLLYGDNGKAAAGIARAGGLDRCIQCQQVGSGGNIGNHRHHRPNMFGSG